MFQATFKVGFATDVGQQPDRVSRVPDKDSVESQHDQESGAGYRHNLSEIRRGGRLDYDWLIVMSGRGRFSKDPSVLVATSRVCVILKQMQTEFIFQSES